MESELRQQTGERQGTGMGLPLWKRVLDLALILVAMPLVLVVGLVVASIVWLGSPGPVLFRQKRVGLKGREFTCFKFRSMRVDSETHSHQQHTASLIKSQGPMVKLDSRKDPRLIPLGSLLRASGLDELPQLINVVRGEMSLVGPRPCIRYEYDLYEDWHRARCDAAPGLTGLWQVSGKNRLSFDQMVKLDIEYAHRQNLWLDVKILFLTFPAIWQQYRDLRIAQRARRESVPSASTVVAASRSLRKSVESYN
jgi:exopolysaccharide production protein ExoY